MRAHTFMTNICRTTQHVLTNNFQKQFIKNASILQIIAQMKLYGAGVQHVSMLFLLHKLANGHPITNDHATQPIVSPGARCREN